ncbi:hypothetical protein C1646_748596 [Rhizophagus diaphanus]|nr:hypothetical protein C1646_748596 [Rhizophagus diaphanus] [Rhizophagus sp. MUCL 43196]
MSYLRWNTWELWITWRVNSGNRNAVRDRGYYGDPTVLSPSSHGNGVGRSVPAMDTLSHESGFPQEHETSKKEKIPCQDVDYLGRQNHDDGCEPVISPINVEFNDFNEKKEDRAIYIRASVRSGQVTEQTEEINKRVQGLRPSLEPLLRIDTLEGCTWTKKISKTCHIVLPDNQFEVRKNEPDAPMLQMSVCDEIDETHGRRRSLSMVVDMVMKSYRNYIATSLGLKVQDDDQGDDIDYIKEDLVGYIEEVRDYGFDHIIIIGERYCGLLFMDCFGRVFSWDSMGNILWLLGDYSEIVERVTKGLKNSRKIPWIVKSNGIVIEIKDDTPCDRYTFPVEQINKKRPKKKSSKKKRHH